MANRFTYGEIARRYREDGAKPQEDAVAIIRKTVKLHGPRLVQEEISGLARAPVDRGTYRRSFHYENIPNGATIFNSALHAGVIEYGRRPGEKAPPLQVIVAWLARKGIVKGAGSRNFATDSQYAKLRSAAFVMARAIKRRGLPAHHVLLLAARKLDEQVRAALARGSAA
jgi:hypothetical protein